MADLSLKTLKIHYECQDKGRINPYFDNAIKDLAKKYGIKLYGTGMDLTTGIRDLAFGIPKTL